MTSGFVEQIHRRRRVRADGIESVRRHLREVAGDPLATRKLTTVGVWRKGAVGCTLYQHPVFANA
jgi:hypothetical protein